MFLLSVGTVKGSCRSCLCHIKRISRIMEKHYPSHGKDPNGSSFMQKGVCWLPQPGDNNEDAHKAQNCKRNIFFLLFSSFLLLHSWVMPACQDTQSDQPPLLLISVYICSWCLFKAYIFSELWYTMPFNSSRLVDNGTQWFSKQVRSHIPELSLHCSHAPRVLFQDTKKRDFVFPSTLTTTQRIVCFLHTQTPLFHAL